MNKELLLGDNPFFGVDNLSQERARKRKLLLDGYDKIVNIMEYVYDEGVKGFVVSTHSEIREFIEYLDSNTNILKKFDFYPILPYAQGYVTKATEKGIVKAASEILSSGTIQNKVKILIKGSIGYLMNDEKKLLETLIDVELLPFSKTNKKIIFLHDGVTDLAFGLEMKNIVQTFCNHVKDKYNVEVGFVTKNLPMIMKKIQLWDLGKPKIMASYNPVGYLMNPSRKDYEQISNKDEIIAMNTLAAGSIEPEKSFNYLSKLSINRMVVGMSTIDHAKETIASFKKYF